MALEYDLKEFCGTANSTGARRRSRVVRAEGTAGFVRRERLLVRAKRGCLVRGKITFAVVTSSSLGNPAIRQSGRHGECRTGVPKLIDILQAYGCLQSRWDVYREQLEAATPTLLVTLLN